MPIWSPDVPKSSEGPALPLRRTPTRKAIVGIITSDDLVGCNTHWWGGHTVPCEGSDCDAHKAGIPFRWHGYLSAIDTTTHLHFIFEMTAQAAEAFKDYRHHHGSLRGCVFEAKRLKDAPNSRVVIRCKPADLRAAHLPQAPDLTKCMAIIWGLPSPQVETHGRLKDHPRIHTPPQPIPDPIIDGNGQERTA